MDVARARKVLGVDASATPAELKRAYWRLAKERHPDRGGTAEAFGELQRAYEALTKPERSTEGSDAFDDDAPLNVGDWFVIRGLALDGRTVTEARAQLVVIKEEILVAIYLKIPWKHSSGMVAVFLSESESDSEIAEYHRPVLQRSSDRDGLTALWFSPFEQRMRVDGYMVGEEPVEEEPNPAFRRTPKTYRWWY